MTHYTHHLKEVNETIVMQEIQIAGWLHNKRNHGGVLFLDIRAFGEKVQVVVEDEKIVDFASKIKLESVLKITGMVKLRPAEAINQNLSSGRVEIIASKIEIESEAQQIPFQINTDDGVAEELRLQYRFLDMRTEKMRQNILLRSSVISYIRKRMEAEGFIEFQTPILTASSPEGARDFLVPSRLNPGKFYALPQAPQQFKQMLMAAGFEKYFQIAPCFRDEDARADRSPGEFYQLDLEMSFATQEQVFSTMEPVLYDIFAKFGQNKTISPYPFKRITYADSMLKYGNDKPDLRNPIEIFDATEFFRNNGFEFFAKQIAEGCVVRGIPVNINIENTSRKFFDDLLEFVKSQGGGGLAYVKKGSDKEPIAKKITDLAALFAGGSGGNCIFFICEKEKMASKFAGLIRTKIGNDLNLINKNHFEFCWVVDFSFYEKNEETGQIEFSHNPFSMPQGGMDSLLLSQEETFEKMVDNIKVGDEDEWRCNWNINPLFSSEFLQKFNEYLKAGGPNFFAYAFSSDTKKSDMIRKMRKSIIENLKEQFYIDPLTIKAYQYDIVCNGIELSSGAIRNHKLDLMFKAFEIAGYSEADVREKFAGMVKAFSYGVPPHGGFAPGVDRMVMLIAGTDSIRDVIPFPLNGKAQDLLMNAPSEVSEKQLRELGLQIRKKTQD